jgi:glycosyltransferase involved in cell wall biosynthesis
MDNQWNRTPRQLLGIATRGLYLHPYFDAGFVAGHRQRVFMKLLGFEDRRIFDGFYSCDVNSFTPQSDVAGPTGVPRSFLYVGRLVDDKGIAELIAAYRLYRERVDHPWPVVVAGQGPLGAALVNEAGVELRGFVQPHELPSTFAASSVLLVPSRYEPWGVVVHEAVSAGLGVIATTAVGSADLLVEPGVNGCVVPVGDVVALADAMQWAHELSDSEWITVATSSRVLSSLRSPQSWVLAVDAMDDLRRSLTIGRDCDSADDDT